mmetsp:Transcript_25881/g.83601  ORF Transcript_25881/g.83601 Transcript_25881/m.83601 type:complete len:219 (-) Transcript_25881:735-1391(-)
MPKAERRRRPMRIWWCIRRRCSHSWPTRWCRPRTASHRSSMATPGCTHTSGRFTATRWRTRTSATSSRTQSPSWRAARSTASSRSSTATPAALSTRVSRCCTAPIPTRQGSGTTSCSAMPRASSTSTRWCESVRRRARCKSAPSDQRSTRSRRPGPSRRRSRWGMTASNTCTRMQWEPRRKGQARSSSRWHKSARSSRGSSRTRRRGKARRRPVTTGP